MQTRTHIYYEKYIIQLASVGFAYTDPNEMI